MKLPVLCLLALLLLHSHSNHAVVSAKKRYLVTGAAGFVGSHVADHLLQRGDEVVVVDEVNDYYDVNIKEGNLRMLQQKYNASVSVHRGDICDADFMDSVFAAAASETENKPFDAICHMAARAGVRPSIQDPFIYVHSNVEGTVKLMEYAVRHKIENFVFASSSSVYGGSKSTYFSELERVDNPISPYAATKKACELFSYVYQHAYGLNVTALRFFTVYGPRGRPDMAPFKFIDRVSRGETLQQFGDGTSSRDYTYIDDIVSGVVGSIDKPTPYQILNLGKGSGTVLKDFLSMVERYVGKPAKVDILPDQPGDVPYTCANVTIAHNHLGYEATVPFEEGIQRTVEWYKQAYPDATSEVVAENRNLLRRRLREVVSTASSSVDKNAVFQMLQDLLEEDSTAFIDEFLQDDPELLQSMLEAMDSMSNTQRAREWRQRRKLQKTEGNNNDNDKNTDSTEAEGEETNWEAVEVLEPHTEHKKILVTGGAGFIGSHVVEYLLKRGDDVVVIDTKDYVQSTELPESAGKVAFHKGDVADAAFMTKVFTDEKPEWICHLAARTNVTHSLVDPVDYIHSNVEGTVRLLELSKGTSFGGSHNIQNFVLASSSTVYGSRKDYGDRKANVDDSATVVRNEDERVDYPKTPYASSKKSAELLAYTFHHLYKIPVTALRLFQVYGPRYRADTEAFQMVDRFLTKSSEDTPIVDSVGDYAFIDDVVQGIVQALDRPYGYEIFNIGGSSSDDDLCGQNSAKEYAATAARLLSVENDDNAVLVPHNVDGVACADTRKAQHMLQYKPETSLEEGLKRTLEWHRQTYYSEDKENAAAGGGEGKAEQREERAAQEQKNAAEISRPEKPTARAEDKTEPTQPEEPIAQQEDDAEPNQPEETAAENDEEKGPEATQSEEAAAQQEDDPEPNQSEETSAQKEENNAELSKPEEQAVQKEDNNAESSKPKETVDQTAEEPVLKRATKDSAAEANNENNDSDSTADNEEDEDDAYDDDDSPADNDDDDNNVANGETESQSAPRPASTRTESYPIEISKIDGDEANVSIFPTFLQSLAFFQWMLVAFVLVLRVYFKHAFNRLVDFFCCCFRQGGKILSSASERSQASKE